MKIVTSGTFRYMGKTYPRDTVLDLPDVVAVEAIDDGVAEPAEEAAPATDQMPPAVPPPADPTPDPVQADPAPADPDAAAKKGKRG